MVDRRCPWGEDAVRRSPRESVAMLSILGPGGRLCDSPSRRDLLTVGTVGLAGLSLPAVLRREARARTATAGNRAGSGFGKAKSVLVLYLQGSPSHIDTW